MFGENEANFLRNYKHLKTATDSREGIYSSEGDRVYNSSQNKLAGMLLIM